MTLDDRLRGSLHASYDTWRPEPPTEVPPPRRSSAPLVAGVGTAVIAGVAVVVAMATTSPAGVQGPPAAGASAAAVRQCGSDDARLSVTTDKASYPHLTAAQAQATLGNYVHVRARLTPVGSGTCRLYGENVRTIFTAPDGSSSPGLASCGLQRRLDPSGATPTPGHLGAWCANDPGFGHVATAPPTADSSTHPGENDDHGVLFAADGAPAPTSKPSPATGGDLVGQPEPVRSEVIVDDSDISRSFAAGTWRVTVDYGTWTATTTFTVTG